MSIGALSEGQWIATKLQGFQFKKLNGQMETIEAIFRSRYISQNVAKSMLSLTSQSCGDSLLPVCLVRQGEVI